MTIEELGKHHIIIDFNDLFTKSVTNINYKQGEIGTSSIKAKLVKKRTPIDLTGCRVILNIMTEKGEPIVDMATILDEKDGIVEIKFEQVSLNTGVHFFEITIMDKNHNTKKSPKIAYRVLDSLSEDAIIESERYPILVNLIREVEELNTRAEGLLNEVEQSKQEVMVLNETITQSETRRENQEETRQQNEVVRQQNETSRINNMNNMRNEMTSTLNTLTSKVDGKITEIQNTSETLIQSVNDKVTEVDLSKNNMVNTVNNKISEINNSFEVVKSEVREDVENKKTELDNRFNELALESREEIIQARDGEVSLKTRLERDLLNTNKEIDKIKKIEESTISIVETDKNLTVVEETNNGYFEDIRLKGRTLVNLWGNKSSDFFLSGQAIFNEETGYVELTSTTQRYSNAFTKYTGNLKPNTLYTIIVDVLENTFSDIPILRVSSADSTTDNNKSCFNESKVINGGQTGEFVFKLTTISDFSNVNIDLRTFVGNDSLEVGCKLKFRIALLEGDHTQNPPDYFEGLKSVGEDIDEIKALSVKSDGNLVDMYGGYTIPNVDIFTNGGSLTYDATNSYHHYKFKRVNFIEGEKYTIVLKGDNCRLLYNNGGLSSTGVVTNGIKYKTFIAQKGSYCERLENSNLGACTVRIDGIWIYKGEYDERKHIPYQSDKKRLLFYNSDTQTWEKPILREWDTIEKHSDGKYYYHKRSGEVLLNGSEKVYDVSEDELSRQFIFRDYPRDIAETTDNKKVQIIADSIPAKSSDDIGSETLNREIFGIALRIKGNRGLFVTIPKTKLEAVNIEGFKKWLQSNPVTVVYRLAEEEVYECTNIDLITYQNGTNYIVESGSIAPVSILKVHNNISNIVTLLQKKVSLLENKFIEGLKQVLAGDMQSLAYVLYPEDFEYTNNTTLEI